MRNVSVFNRFVQFVTLFLLLFSLELILLDHYVAQFIFTDTWVGRMFPITLAINILFILMAFISIWMSSRWAGSKSMRTFRYLMLIASVAILGFVQGGCPCVISYFQNSVLYLLGNEYMIGFFIPFVILLVLTYMYGKVWCGWLCPLGALQDLIYIGRWTKLRDRVYNPKLAKYVARTIQVAAFVALVTLLIVKQMPWYCRYDPFKALFRLSVNGQLMHTLVILLIVFSVLYYRPFCKAFCPVGLLLNLVSMIPGAHRVRIDEDGCRHCKRCEKKCPMYAIQDDKVDSTCIHCGECTSTQCRHLNS